MGRGAYIRTDEHLKKSRNSFTGENNPMYGKHHSEEIKNKLSQMYDDRCKDGKYIDARKRFEEKKNKILKEIEKNEKNEKMEM